MTSLLRSRARTRNRTGLLPFLPPQTRAAAAGVLILMAAMTAFRLAFLFVNRTFYAGFSAGELAGAFLLGGRFDLHTVLALSAPFFLLLHLPGRWKGRVWLRGPLLWAPPVLFAAVSSLVVIDLHYYTDAGRHLSQEVLTVTGNAGDLLSALIMIWSYKGSIVLYLLFAALLMLSWGRIVSRPWKEGPGVGALSEAAWMAAFLLLAGLGIRGTLEAKPLRTTHAFAQGSLALGHLALNPLYTVGGSLAQSEVRVPRFTGESEAVGAVRSLVSQPGEAFASTRFPLYRTQEPLGTEGPRNLVLLVMESWSGFFAGALGAEPSATPRFDALAKDGLLFTDFIAPGRRSQEAMTAILLGLPPLPDADVHAGALAQNSFRGLARVLAEAGYSSVFVHGGKVGTLGLNGFAKVAGFDRYVGMEDLELSAGDYDGAWGVYDHVVLEHLVEEIGAMKPPFLALWFSLSSHEPFSLPKGFALPQGGPEGNVFATSIRYADASLGAFFDRARKEPWFANTVFVVLGDHVAGKLARTAWERHRVPLFIYAPGFVEPGTVTETASQTDLLPTALDLCGVPGRHSALGVSLLRPRTGFAFASMGGRYGWFRDGALVTVDGEGQGEAAFDYRSDRRLEAVDKARLAELRAVLQVTKTVLRDNRVAPAH